MILATLLLKRDSPVREHDPNPRHGNPQCPNKTVTCMKTGYLIDMDGVIYLENHLIPMVTEFIQALISTGAPFLFLTNNSAPTPEDLGVRLRHLGISGLSPRHF